MSDKAANPINIRLIDHVVIRAVDLDKMLDFYQSVLGCRLERGPGELGLAQLRAGESLIDIVDAGGKLGREGGDAPDPGAPNMDHVCLLLDPWDDEAIVDHLHAHGVEVGEIANRYGTTGTGPSIYLQDPEGNRVELKGRV